MSNHIKCEVHVYRKLPAGGIELVALAPLELKDAVDVAVSNRNREAQAVKTGKRYFLSTEAPVVVFTSQQDVVIP